MDISKPALQALQVLLVAHVLQFVMMDRQFWTHYFLSDEIVEMLLQVAQRMVVWQVWQLSMKQMACVHTPPTKVKPRLQMVQLEGVAQVAQFVSVQIGLHRVYALLTLYPLEHELQVVDRSQVEHWETRHSSWQYPVLVLKLYPLRQEVQTEGDEQLWQKGSRQMAMQVVPLWLSLYPL